MATELLTYNPVTLLVNITDTQIQIPQIQLTLLDIILVSSSFSLILTSYWIGEVILSSNTKFMKLKFYRKRYVIKNFIKAIYLYLLTIYSVIYIKDLVLHDIWDNNAIKLMGLMYCLPDLISLYRVPKMQMATIHHHRTTTILALLNLFNDYSKDTYWRGMIIYGYLSMITGIVNFYLGYRVIFSDNHVQLKKNIAKTAFIVYVSSLLLNWSYQLYIISKWITIIPLFGLYEDFFIISR